MTNSLEADLTSTIHPPKSMHIIGVRVPFSLWGHDIDHPEKAREMVKKYLYGGFTIVGTVDTENGFVVCVQQMNYVDESAQSAQNQCDRLGSGGMAARLMASYTVTDNFLPWAV
jgi:hypothetical protein